ncbi:potassium/proton antiporter [Bacteriovorax sp. Seq25_V]|uniref:potassium/proton antiporter n=1 Tax=Bacteriovorax sp. Seq25_V TaxID=1201288 RepID=UPI00038A07A7|nr:potassium/proton antiporter [Bacteriovorax sp. Seq25_V]EQC47439.1 transporter, CPA2 family [Bacteriovorax sp. Seq25_V]
MEYILNNALLIGSILLLISVYFSKSSSRFGLPILVFFLFVGIAAGSEGIGGIAYENYELTHSLSLLAICLIIFSGGLLTKSQDIRPVLRSGISLSSLGVVITTASIGIFCYYLFSVPIFESLLIGAILSSTDAAAVFTAFRDRNFQVSKNVRYTLELESGSNDPMAYLLVTVFLGFYQQKMSFNFDTLQFFVANPIIGFCGGVAFFRLFKFLNDKVLLDFQGLYPAVALGFVFLTYSTVTLFHGNGLLAVYLFGLNVGNSKIPHKNSLVSFFDGMSWLCQIGLFIMLGMLVFPSRLLSIAPAGFALALFSIFIARPIAVHISLAFSKFKMKEKALISWAGLKGATPIVFASLVATHVGNEANFIFDVVFFAVLVSALMQGSTINFVAKKLELLFECVHDPDFPVDMEVLAQTKSGIGEFQIKAEDFAVNKKIYELGLPRGARIIFVKRSGSFVIPDGQTSLKEHDKILFVTQQKEEVELTVNAFSLGLEEQAIILPEDIA